MFVNVLLGQIPISWNVADNKTAVRTVLEQATAHDLVVLPEGMISGYDDELSEFATLNSEGVMEAIDAVAEMVRDQRVHLICGTLLPENGAWFNAAIYFSPSGEREIYRKVNLATKERPKLTAGSQLSVFNIQFDEGLAAVSPQICRELRFPDQWHYLARQGAKLFTYLTYAANLQESMSVWRSHIVSRAAETQRFVIAVNVAHPDQHCPTMVVAPSGEVVAEVRGPESAIIRAAINIDDVSDWYVNQQRSDIVRITYLG